VTGRNIKLFYILEAVLAFSGGIILPAYVLYFRHFEITLFQVAILAVVFEATIIVFEIPTGIFADRYGRKLSTVIGFLLLTVSGIIFFMYRGFIGFLIAEIVFGIAETFISGALEALTVDSLEKDNRGKKLARLMANRTAVKNGGLLIGMVLGGLIAGKFLTLLFAPVIFFGAAGFSASVFLSEIKEDKNDRHNRPSVNAERNSVATSIIRNRVLRALFAVGLLANLAFEGADQYWQVVFSEIKNIPPEYFGLLTAAGLILVIAFARISERLYEHLSAYLAVCFVLISISLLLVTTAGLCPALAGIVAYFTLKELTRPVISYHLNRRIPSEKRAVYLSGFNLACSVGEVASGILVGYLAAEYGVVAVFTFAAVSAVVVLAAYLFLYHFRTDSAV
jgi:MFS family permease